MRINDIFFLAFYAFLFLFFLAAIFLRYGTYNIDYVLNRMVDPIHIDMNFWNIHLEDMAFILNDSDFNCLGLTMDSWRPLS